MKLRIFRKKTLVRDLSKGKSDPYGVIQVGNQIFQQGHQGEPQSEVDEVYG